MLIEKVVTNSGVIYGVDISNEETREYLKSLGVDIVSVVKAELQRKLLRAQKQRLQKVLEEYGYNSLGDVQLYASQNDTEAKALLGWYQAYDDGIWNWIDNTLPNYQTLDELLNLDLKAIEEEIFNQSIQASPLP